MTHATHDLAVKTGEYVNRDGETKARWVNIGKELQTDDGGRFLLINRHFNPAGIPNPEDRDTVAISLFKIDRDEKGTKKQDAHNQAKSNGYQKQPDPELNDDLPF